MGTAKPKKAERPPVIRAAWTVREVCRQLGCGKKVVLRLIRSRRLRAVRLGRSYRVPVAALEAFLMTSTFTPAPPMWHPPRGRKLEQARHRDVPATRRVPKARP
jgi:excisionase family DNA binding protein